MNGLSKGQGKPQNRIKRSKEDLKNNTIHWVVTVGDTVKIPPKSL